MTDACPCPDAHRRLMDLHEDIHRAADAYYDADEFRRYLNTALQNSRSVSWLLQKRKARWPDFDEWYGAWQERACLNPVMSWGVRSRNRIVKEEDLRTLSLAELSYYGPASLQSQETVLVPASVTPQDILDVFADAISRDSPSGGGAIRVVRKWVDDKLPEHELLAALRELHGGVADAVREAHRRSGVARCSLAGPARPCIGGDIDPTLLCLPVGPPSASIDLDSGDVSHVRHAIIERDTALEPQLLDKYGRAQSFGRGPLIDIDERVNMAKAFLEVDGFVGTGLYFYQGDQVARVVPFHISVGQPPEMAVVHAIEAVGALDFDGAMLATEAWLSRPPSRATRASPFYAADPVGGRAEAITVYGVSRTGGTRSYVVAFDRDQSPVAYETVMDDTDPRVVPGMLMGPLQRRWTGRFTPRGDAPARP